MHSHRNLFTRMPVLAFDLNLFLNLMDLIGIKWKRTSLEITVCLTVTHLLKNTNWSWKKTTGERNWSWMNGYCYGIIVSDSCNFCSCKLNSTIFNYHNSQITVMNCRIFVLLKNLIPFFKFVLVKTHEQPYCYYSVVLLNSIEICRRERKYCTDWILSCYTHPINSWLGWLLFPSLGV